MITKLKQIVLHFLNLKYFTTFKFTDKINTIDIMRTHSHTLPPHYGTDLINIIKIINVLYYV